MEKKRKAGSRFSRGLVGWMPVRRLYSKLAQALRLGVAVAARNGTESQRQSYVWGRTVDQPWGHQRDRSVGRAVAVTPVMLAALHARDVLRHVEARLVDGGGVVELGQFRGLSADEMDVLLRLERGLA